jgi:ABC-2 type transport system ATP-binding protein
MEKAFQQCVTEVSRRGAAVLLSSHILAEVEKLCDTVTIIRAGRTVQAGTLQQLRHLMRTTVTARTRAGDPGVWDWPGVQDAGTGNGELRLSVDRDHLDATMGRLTRLGIVDLTVTPASLEDLFLREYRGAYPDEEP